MVEKKETGQPHFFPSLLFFFCCCFCSLLSLPPFFPPSRAHAPCFAARPRGVSGLGRFWEAGHWFRWKRSSFWSVGDGIAVRTSLGVRLLWFTSCLSTGWVPLQKRCRCKRNQGIFVLIYEEQRRWVEEMVWHWAPSEGVLVRSVHMVPVPRKPGHL